MSDTPSRKRIFVCRPETAEDELPCARKILGKLVRQAFRRPVTDADLAVPLEFFENGRANGNFETGIRSALTIVLASPEFLYRIEPVPDDTAPGAVYPVSDVALASRLSFFLWSRLPDEELLSLAEQGRLSNPDVLRKEVGRMLADPRAESLVTNFAAQWLDVRDVPNITPDPVLFPGFNPDLAQSFVKELNLFLSSVLLEDHSVLDLLDADYSFVNERLALHYGIGSVRGDAFRRVRLDDENRWGLFGKGAVLMATSYPNRTAPVLRGAWILESIMGTPPASPPANVPGVPRESRGRGAAHRARAAREAPRKSDL